MPKNLLSFNPKTLVLLIIVILLISTFAIGAIKNRHLSNKINDSLLENKPFILKNHFKNAKLICVLEPYFDKTQNILAIHPYLTSNKIIRLNRKVASWAEDSHWDLVVIYDNDYQVYHIAMKSFPNFDAYQCASVAKDEMTLYPVRKSANRVAFELR